MNRSCDSQQPIRCPEQILCSSWFKYNKYWSWTFSYAAENMFSNLICLSSFISTCFCCHTSGIVSIFPLYLLFDCSVFLSKYEILNFSFLKCSCFIRWNKTNDDIMTPRNTNQTNKKMTFLSSFGPILILTFGDRKHLLSNSVIYL